MVDEVAEGALQGQGFGGEGAGGFEGASVIVLQSANPGGGSVSIVKHCSKTPSRPARENPGRPCGGGLGGGSRQTPRWPRIVRTNA